MNSKSFVLAGVLSLGFAGLAGASTQYIYVTGSTAARGAFYSAVTDGSTVFDAAPTFAGMGNATGSKCGYMVFSNTISGTPTIIKCTWSGSEGGIGDLAGNLSESFLVDSVTGTSASSPSSAQLTTAPVDLCAADNSKLYSKNPKSTIVGTEVCVITFAWVKEKGSASTLTDVHDAALRVALSGGTPLALFTGNAADTTWVYVSGRDNNSGTRVNAMGNTGYGIFGAPFMIQVNADGSMLDQTGSGDILGDYGYSGGGSLATQMGYDLSVGTSKDLLNGSGSDHFSVIAYLGRSDANTAIGASVGGTELTYNGVAFSAAAIKEGQYTFWGNEYIYHKSSPTTQALAVYNKLTATAGISSHADGSTTIKLADMHAVRNGPTDNPVHK